MRTRLLLTSVAVVLTASLSAPLGAQLLPNQPIPVFFGPAAPVAFNPEPSAVVSGVSMAAGATVSADKKYVNLNMAPQQQALLGVQNFPVYAQGGFVSADNATGVWTNKFIPDPGRVGMSRNPPVVVSTSAPLQGILGQPGMTRIASLKN
jgi:hypothetical protein